MRYKNIFLLFFISILLSDFAFSQEAPAKRDSSTLYRNIEKFSNKRRFTKFIYNIFFRAVEVPVAPVSKNTKEENLQKPYSAFQGKIIREMHITTLDPFGYSLTDTSFTSQKFLKKIGNKLHYKSQRLTIRNLLLIHKNEPFDSLLIKESERLIRSQVYVHDVAFRNVLVGENLDSVDVFIREMDVWSIIPEGSISASNTNLDLYEKNFLGFGHEIRNIHKWIYAGGKNANNINYFIPNIRNTYISTNLHYEIDENKNTTKSWSVDRPFFSPLAKWAAGAYLNQQFHKDSIHGADSIKILQSFKKLSQDYWAGNARQIFKGNTEDKRTTILIIAARYIRSRYLEKPSEYYDPLHTYAKEDFYLLGVGISTRKYVQDKYIFKYGITEDVPIGRSYGLTVGYQVKNNTHRLYYGFRIAYGSYNAWGYLSSNFEYGTFLRSSKLEQEVFTAGLNYFTNLLEIGKWKFRQFVKPQLVIGKNRFPTESLNINNENGLRGFNSSELLGTQKLVFTFQTQIYAPWRVIGFRFAAFLVYSVGMLGNEENGFRNTKAYSQIGLGLLIKNEYLVLNSFQVSVSFYPLIPGTGNNIFIMNKFKTTDFGYRDFDIGRPSIVGYQ